MTVISIHWDTQAHANKKKSNKKKTLQVLDCLKKLNVSFSCVLK